MVSKINSKGSLEKYHKLSVVLVVVVDLAPAMTSNMMRIDDVCCRGNARVSPCDCIDRT